MDLPQVPRTGRNPAASRIRVNVEVWVDGHMLSFPAELPVPGLDNAEYRQQNIAGAFHRAVGKAADDAAAFVERAYPAGPLTERTR